PDELSAQVLPGVRVVVPFGRGNRRSEGIVLALGQAEAGKKLKYIDSVLDGAPVLDASMIKLAMWMRERFFCTVYDAVRAMLPAGLWYSVKTEYTVATGVGRDAAYAAAGQSARESAVLDFAFDRGGSFTERELESAVPER